MRYELTKAEVRRMGNALRTAMAIPFIDDIEDYVVESIWAYTKGIDGIDPFNHIRSKQLYDVVDPATNVGWSVKSLQWPFMGKREFELVIQRADVYKKANALGFPGLSSASDPNEIGAALLKHWHEKVYLNAVAQHVTSKRVFILLKTADKRRFLPLEEDIHIYQPGELWWKWTDEKRIGLQGIRRSDGMCVYRWYSSQKQFFERFQLPPYAPSFTMSPQRLEKDEVINLILPYLQERG